MTDPHGKDRKRGRVEVAVAEQVDQAVKQAVRDLELAFIELRLAIAERRRQREEGGHA